MSDEHERNLDVDDLLGEALNEAPAEEELEATPPPRPASGGYQPLIAQKRKQVKELEAKVESHRQTGVYITKGDDGREYIDHMAFQEDNARISKLTREIGELRDAEREQAHERQRRNASATEVAKGVLRRGLANVDEGRRRAVAEAFAALLKNLTASGEWMKAPYADKAKIEAGLTQVLDTAVGHAMRQSWAGVTPGGAPAESAPKREAVEDELDDFTNNLLYAHERRQRRSMTVAEAKALAAAEKGGAA